MYVDFGNLLAIVSLILGIVALVITILGFFASLKFYVNGMKLQEKSNKAMNILEEKTSTIQNQLGGMFDKTLEAALGNGKGNLVSRDFDDINDQLEKTKNNLIKQVASDITSIGDAERKKLEEILTEQFKLIEDQVNVSQENAEDLLNQPDSESSPITQSQLKILNALRTSNKALLGQELAELLNVNYQVLKRDIDRLKRKNLITETSHGEQKKYSLADLGGNKLEILVSEAFERASTYNSQPHIAKLGLELRKIDPTFHPRKYGFGNLSELLSSLQNFDIIDNYVDGLNHPIIRKKESR